MASSRDNTDDDTRDRDQLPQHIRERVLDRDNHTCRLCGEKGPGAGGIMELEVHHVSYAPEDCDLHDLENLLTLCRRCHNFHHNRPSDGPLPAEISEEAKAKLIETDIEIIQLLSDDGPLTVDEIKEQLTADKTRQAVKERLYRVMGLDNEVESQEIRLIDQDKDTGKWCIPHQIDVSERRIPDERQAIVRRTIHKIVQLGLEAGCDRETVATIVGINFRTSYIYQYRAYAYDFPVDLYTGKGRPMKNGGGDISYEDIDEKFVDDETEYQTDTDEGDGVVVAPIPSQKVIRVRRSNRGRNTHTLSGPFC